MLADLVVHRLGVALDRVLGRDVDGHVGLGDEPGDGGDVDDAPAALGAHVRQDRLGHPDDAEDVDVDDLLVLRDGELLGGACGADAGVVDQDVHPAEPRDHVLDRGGHGGVAGDVEVQERQARRAGDAGCVAARPDHLEPGVDQAEGGLLADARGGARHERHRLLRCHRELLDRLSDDRNIMFVIP